MLKNKNKIDDNNEKINLSFLIENDLYERLSRINKNSEEALYDDYIKKLERLIIKENRTLNSIKNKTSEKNIHKIESHISKHIEELGIYEEALSDKDNPKINTLLLQANKLYRETQAVYIELKFNYLNKRLDDKINDTEKSTTELMFNIISIFLGISITSAMVAGLEFVTRPFIVFYFLSCAWVALTILTISSVLLKRLEKNIVVIIIWSIYTIIWIGVGRVSLDIYNSSIERTNILEKKEIIQEKEEQMKVENTNEYK